VSWEETSNTRKERLASALPIMEADIGLFPGDEITLRARVENAGVGSALVYSARLTLDGEPILDGNQFESAVLDGRLSLADATGSVDAIELTPVPAGKVFLPLSLSWDSDVVGTGAYDQLSPRFIEQRVAIELCFCDVYERCWKTIRRGFPERVEGCPETTGFPTSLLATE
jgi:hypothetical protein